MARVGKPGQGGGKPVKVVVAYIDGRKRLDGVITLDNDTLDEYSAENSSSDRIDAVIAALSGTVSVKVYDGSGVEKASGTMNSPWATNVDGQCIVGTLASFSVTGAGTPDAAWYLRFEAGARWVRGSFGLRGSGQEFTWSQSTWAVGHTGRIGSIVMLAPTTAAPTWTGAPTTLSLVAGNTYNFGQHASDPNGDPLTYSLVAGNSNNYTVHQTTGVLTVGNVSQSVTVRVSDGVLTADHVCAVTVASEGANLIDTIEFDEGYTDMGSPWGSGADPRLYSSGNKPQIVSAASQGIPARRGTHLMRSYLNRDTSATTFRTEAVIGSPSVNEFVKGTEYWAGISVYLPSDWAGYPSGGRSTGILWQFHDRAGTILPCVAYHTASGWNLVNQTYGNRSGGNGNLQAFSVYRPFILGGWNDFVINVIFSGTTASPNLQNGTMRIWVNQAANETPIVNYTNVQTYFGEQTLGPYFKFGVYQWSWQPSNMQYLSGSETPDRLCWHDGIRIGSASSSFAEVMP